MSLPSALSVCHTGIPNVWLRRQVSFLFAEKRNIFGHRTISPKFCFLLRHQSILNFYNTKPHIHMRRLTGSLAASWQRCTRLSNVDLRAMWSAGISFCSTLSAGSCWRSWGSQGSEQHGVLHIWWKELFHVCVSCVADERVKNQATWCTPTCMLGSWGAPGGTWACSWGWGASTGNPITGAVIGAGGV